MEFRELDGQSSITFTHWQYDKNFYGMDGVRATISVQSSGVAGTYMGVCKGVWFRRDAFVAFVQALRSFTHHHKGEARLESWQEPDSTAPKEAVVSVSRLDAAAHILIEAQLSGSNYLRDREFMNSVSLAFELAPVSLPGAVDALGVVLAEGGPSSFDLELF